MTVTETTICNDALIKLGAQTILSLDDNNDVARKLKNRYPQMRNLLLASHPWNFATKRLELAPDPVQPLYQYAQRFLLPADCLRVYGTDLPEPQEWVVEDGFLLCHFDIVRIRYIREIVETAKYPPAFVEALSSFIAFEMCYGITQSGSLKEAMKKYFDADLRLARSYDGQEGAGTRIYADTWLNARY